ncbi:Cytochrome c oxidase subunit 6B-like protein new16 [Rhodotorula toruloides]|nr:Cytochrome c oxidase subunit 6B-like protein new16 [Rhodotorula toruloides]
MGWFSSSSSSDSVSISGAAPDRSQRSQCWESRDAYFACLDKNGVQVPGQEGEACKKENNEYKGKCAGSWGALETWDALLYSYKIVRAAAAHEVFPRSAVADFFVPFPSFSSSIRQVDYFNKRRVLQLRQDLMERRAAEQVASASK